MLVLMRQALIACLVAGALATEECGHTPIAPDLQRVVGGQPAEPYSWPWQAELCLNRNPIRCSFCGGTLIDNQHIMSAAHCIATYLEQPWMFFWKLGSYDTRHDNEPGEIIVGVSHVNMHPQYQNPLDQSNDLSIFRLNETIQFNDHIQPICLPRNIANIAVDTNDAYVTGWGVTVDPGGSSSVILQQARIPFVNLTDCKNDYPGEVDDAMVCAGKTGVSACHGDSGGPLVFKNEDNGRWYQAGIVSFHEGDCASEGHPEVFINPAALCDYINEIVGYDLCSDR